eukprot:GHVR01175224.1.p1 GENE.GHVR01175224.1~~GHVR01175224.1.p1  ORF type:complete len:299 (+),score=10.43 GHVR01175224.1:110-1006(+)
MDDNWPEFGICESTVPLTDLFSMYDAHRLICLLIILCIIFFLRYNMTGKDVYLTIVLSIMIFPLSRSCFATVCAWISIIFGHILSQVTNNDTQPPVLAIVSSMLGVCAVFFVFTVPLCVPHKFIGSIFTVCVFLVSSVPFGWNDLSPKEFKRVMRNYWLRIITMTILMIPLLMMRRNIYLKGTIISKFVEETKEYNNISFIFLFIHNCAVYAMHVTLKVTVHTAEALVTILTFAIFAIVVQIIVSILLIDEQSNEADCLLRIAVQNVHSSISSPFVILFGFIYERVAMIDVIYFVIYL